MDKQKVSHQRFLLLSNWQAVNTDGKHKLVSAYRKAIEAFEAVQHQNQASTSDTFNVHRITLKIYEKMLKQEQSDD